MPQNKTVVVGMSGGVDSSVSAVLLQKQGYKVIGAMMKIWDGRPLPRETSAHSCYGPEEIEDEEDARKIAQSLGIDFYTFDLAEEYNHQVLETFCQEYLKGRTPNPCVLCNHKIKFGALIKKLSQAGIAFDYFATGHYARSEFDPQTGRWLLKKGKDTRKDQSYFLYHLSQEQISRTIFPLGNLHKEEVRKLAQKFGLNTALKKESQDFIAGSNYSILFKDSYKPGPILDDQGNILGQHKGIIFYTIGQRKGLGISSNQPLYVRKIIPEKNAIVVAPRERLFAKQLLAQNLNWIALKEPKEPIWVKAKIRQQHQPADALVIPLSPNRVKVQFEQPQSAITPGQAVVFYQDDIVLGGGTIQEAILE